MPVVFSLSRGEWTAAESIGKKRHWWKVKQGKAQAETNDGGGTWEHKNGYGAVAEYALARLLGPALVRDWVESGKAFSTTPWLLPCDVGRDLHVRAVEKESARFLVVHEDRNRERIESPVSRRDKRVSDPQDGVFIMAWADAPTCRVTFWGWEYAAVVRARVPSVWNTEGTGFREEDRHAYTLDRKYLRPIDTIPQEAIW